jgi:dihydrofolate reductase
MHFFTPLDDQPQTRLYTLHLVRAEPEPSTHEEFDHWFFESLFAAMTNTVSLSGKEKYSCVMRPLRYSINVTLDGCCDHRAMLADEDLHRHAAENLDQADALVFGRVTYEMMEAAFRPPTRTGARPDQMEPFARTIDAAKKYVVSSALDRVDWNAELVRGDLGKAVQQLKRESGKGLFAGGVKLPLALAELGLIDEYEFLVQPKLADHGPTLFAGLSKYVDLRLVGWWSSDRGRWRCGMNREGSHWACQPVQHSRRSRASEFPISTASWAFRRKHPEFPAALNAIRLEIRVIDSENR